MDFFPINRYLSTHLLSVFVDYISTHWLSVFLDYLSTHLLSVFVDYLSTHLLSVFVDLYTFVICVCRSLPCPTLSTRCRSRTSCSGTTRFLSAVNLTIQAAWSINCGRQSGRHQLHQGTMKNSNWMGKYTR